ncbi:hypothetical protein C5167_031749 [Papaver somniferum]|uniref:Cyclin N-terminal domain-containing protein n=1 Tax=Papaver somniferum TaxID=3469 RepID=A0A4Y7K550_PAPSO|nr:hypothetical protein C5167_031716 [Papaver somniferum]RZC68484.1 hypothetical protein C5167_031749 [Papaver somniferum]
MSGKYEEGSAAKVEKYLNAANHVYCNKKEIRDMERLIVKKLGWNLSFVKALLKLIQRWRGQCFGWRHRV